MNNDIAKIVIGLMLLVAGFVIGLGVGLFITRGSALAVVQPQSTETNDSINKQDEVAVQIPASYVSFHGEILARGIADRINNGDQNRVWSTLYQFSCQYMNNEDRQSHVENWTGILSASNRQLGITIDYFSADGTRITTENLIQIGSSAGDYLIIESGEFYSKCILTEQGANEVRSILYGE